MGIAQREYMRAPTPGRGVSALNAVPVIIVINVVVFALWYYGKTESRELTLFMNDQFTVSWFGVVSHGRLWTTLTAAFSHYHYLHLFVNMFVLYSFGTAMEQVWGRRRFVAFYLIAALGGSAGFLLVAGLVEAVGDSRGLGASGAISGLLIAFALMFPRQKILLFFIIPLPAIFAALFFVGFDIWGLTRQIQGDPPLLGINIGHGAHLGGAAIGLGYYLLFLRPGARRTRPRELEVDYNDADASRMDFLLQKVSEHGLDALTPEEREFLIRMSQKMQSRR